jgi:predicted transcriptional regulator
MQITEKPVTISQKIITLLTTNPGRSMDEIATELQVKKEVVKVIIHKMTAKGLIVGEKVAREVKTKNGPQKVLRYKVPAL